MRTISNVTSFATNSLVSLKNQDWVEKQRIAGKVAASALSLLEQQVKNKTTLSLLELNQLAEEFILDQKCSLTFKGYKGFPAGVCISVNKQLVHGIPTQYYLQEGDIVSFDLGTTFQGVIADSALTCIYGRAKSEQHLRLLEVTETALLKGIQSIKIGNRIGCIGNAIHKYIKSQGFNTIEKYGGHGLDLSEEGIGIPHAAPFVSNKSTTDEGIRIQSGLSIAIEPMAIIGDTYTFVNSDGWTVCAENISSHDEHSIFVHPDHVEVMTWRENETRIQRKNFYY